MVTLKEYEAYLKAKRFIDVHDEAEIISRLIGDNKYVPLIIKSDSGLFWTPIFKTIPL